MKAAALLERWFLRAVDTRRLALCRIAVAHVMLTAEPISYVPRHLQSVPLELAQPVTLTWPLFLGGMPPDWLILALITVEKIVLVLLLLGVRTRVVGVLAAVVCLLLHGIDNSFGKVTCLATPAYITLIVCALSPWGEALSIDAYLRRQRPRSSVAAGAYCRLLHALLGLFLLGAALQKLRHAPEAWVFGDQLLGYTIDIFDPANPTVLGPLLIAYPVLCRLFGIGSILFEGSLWISFFSDRLAILYFFAGVAFHVGIYLAMGIDGETVLPWYLAFLPWEQWLDRWRERRSPQLRAA
jgi:hypothetical protein